MIVGDRAAEIEVLLDEADAVLVAQELQRAPDVRPIPRRDHCLPGKTGMVMLSISGHACDLE